MRCDWIIQENLGYSLVEKNFLRLVEKNFLRKYLLLLVPPSVTNIGEWRAVRGLCQTKDGDSPQNRNIYEIGLVPTKKAISGNLQAGLC